MNEFDSFFDDIKIETDKDDMNKIKKTVKRKARIHTAVTTARNLVLAMVLLCGITFVGINTSPTLAKAASKIPIIRYWILSTNENGIKEALENDCETIVNQTRSIKNGEITLSYVVADEANLIFAFEGNFKDKREGSIQLQNVKIKNLDTGKTKDDFNHTFPFFDTKDTNSTTCEIFRWLDTESGKWDFPDKIEITVDFDISLKTLNDDNSKDGKYDNYSQTVSYIIDLKEPQPAREYAVNKNYKFNNQKMSVDRVVIFPTCTNIYYSWDDNNTDELMHIKFEMAKKDGSEVLGKSVTISGDELCQTIQSGYYSVNDDFSLSITSLYLLPKDKKDVAFDTKTYKLYDKYGEIKNAFVPDKDDSRYEEAYNICEFDENNRSIPIILDVHYKDTILMNSFSITEEYPSLDDEVSHISVHSGSFDSSNPDEDTIMCSLPKVLLDADEDGMIHLERNYPETLLYPNEVITIRK